MKIEVNLYASLGKYRRSDARDRPWAVDVADGATVGELLDGLGVPADEVKMIFLNGLHAGREASLKEGDRLGVFPPVGGG